MSIRSKSLVLLLALFLLPSLASSQQRPLRPAADLAADQMTFAAGAEVSIAASETGLAGFLRTTPGAPIPVALQGDADQRARSFLGAYASAFGLGKGIGLQTLRVTPPDETGMEHVRYQQTVAGVPVTGGEISVHLVDAGVVAVHANTVPDLARVDTKPLVSATEALVLAKEELEGASGVTDFILSEPRLELLNRGLLGARGFSTDLSWFIEARGTDLRQYLWIDARAGKVVLQFSQLTDARNRRTYDANDPGDGMYGSSGPLVRTEGQGPISGPGAADVNAAHDYAGDTYDYYWSQHGRDSYDDAGAPLDSIVRFCPSAGQCPYANAVWNGSLMIYGTGYPLADDVVAHELTHAVTEYSANLFYYMQSGALNESYSDIFGETVDLLNGSGNDSSGVRWRIGENAPGGAIRNMSNPGAFSHPGRTGDPNFYCLDDFDLDSGGVHLNSGVPNHAYALMVDGGSYNGQTVSGIGLTKAAKIQYRSLTTYLLSASDFLDNYHALEQSCQDLVGIAGITAANCTQVTRALDAVEMDQTWPCTPPQAAAPAACPASQSPNLWYSDDVESGGLPACPSGAASSSWCLNTSSSLFGPFATSGVNSLWGYNKSTTDAIAVQVLFGSMPPAGSRLRFNHSYGFENNGTSYYDGGQIHYTTNGGSTWFQGGSLITAGQGYTGTISTCCGNPFQGQSAFVGDSYGYTSSQLNLSGLSGSAFGFRFVVATDSLIDDLGWFVDDMAIFTCATCLTNRTLDSGYNGLASEYKASNMITAGDGFTVGPGEAVILQAGNRVVLADGFVAGGKLTVKAGVGCP